MSEYLKEIFNQTMDDMIKHGIDTDMFNWLTYDQIVSNEILTKIAELRLLLIVGLGIVIILGLIGFAIFWNQRKICKELRQLRELMEATSSDDQTNE